MTERPLSPLARASALPRSSRPGRADYEMIAHLRAACANGDEAVLANERYDLDFSIKLSNCRTNDAAEGLLAKWLETRVATLQHTQVSFRQVWIEAQVDPEERP